MQAVFVYEVVLGQGLGQDAAAIHEDVFAGLLFELADGFDDVVADEGGVAPGGGGWQGGGDDVFMDAIEDVGEGVAGHGFKGGAVYLPGFTAEQEGVGLGDGVIEVGADVVVPEGVGPAAVCETAVDVFVCAAGGLDHAVQGDEFGYD